MPPTKPVSIRIPEDEREDAEEKMKVWGYQTLAAFVRFALRRVPRKPQ